MTDTSISIVFPPAVVVIFAPGAVIVVAAPMPVSMDILVDIAPAIYAARTNSDLVMTKNGTAISNYVVEERNGKLGRVFKKQVENAKQSRMDYKSGRKTGRGPAQLRKNGTLRRERNLRKQ